MTKREIMNKIICTIFLSIFSITMYGQSEVLTLYKKDGTTVQYSFIDKPVIHSQGENIIVHKPFIAS